MEFTKDIYFNDSLRNGKPATITYSGELFKSGSEHVNLVFGFGENWDYTTTLPMSKTENGFTAEIEIKDYDTFNFCFSNEHNNWDNNNSFNYISPILPKIEENPVEEINYGSDYSSSIDDIIEDILGNTVQNNIVNDKEADSADKILESITQETLPEIEKLFNELFSNDIDEVKPVVEENIVPEADSSVEELVKLFNELFEADNEIAEAPVLEATVNEEAKLNIAEFNLDGLVSELLEPVIARAVTNTDNEVSLFDDINKVENDEETALTVVDSKDFLVSPRRLSALYTFKKKIKIACYKLFVKVPKELAKQLGFGEN